jgi:hypothetical protein
MRAAAIVCTTKTPAGIRSIAFDMMIRVSAMRSAPPSENANFP